MFRNCDFSIKKWCPGARNWIRRGVHFILGGLARWNEVPSPNSDRLNGFRRSEFRKSENEDKMRTCQFPKFAAACLKSSGRNSMKFRFSKSIQACWIDGKPYKNRCFCVLGGAGLQLVSAVQIVWIAKRGARCREFCELTGPHFVLIFRLSECRSNSDRLNPFRRSAQADGISISS